MAVMLSAGTVEAQAPEEQGRYGQAGDQTLPYHTHSQSLS